MAISARYVHKQLDTAIEDTGTLDAAGNEIYFIANPGEGITRNFFDINGVEHAYPAKTKRDYDALELAFDKRLADNWSFRASYTLSRLYGNYAGLSQSDENGRVSPNVGRNFDYWLMLLDENAKPVFGRLATDRPHQFKAQFIYDFNFGTTVGLNEFVGSGIPVTREFAAIPSSQFPMQYKGRLSDGRTDTLSQTDFYVQHNLKLGGERRLQLFANVQNLFNQRIATNKFQTQNAAGYAVDFDETDFFNNGADFDAQIASLGPSNIVIDPRFLKASEYQEPRAVRVGVKFLF
jgi:hypothetical protein